MRQLGLEYKILGEKGISVLVSIELHYTYPACILDLKYTEHGNLYQLKIIRTERKKTNKQTNHEALIVKKIASD